MNQPAKTIQLDPQAEKELAALMVELSNDKDFRPTVNKFLKKRGGKVLPDVELEDMREELKRDREAEKQEREKEKALAKIEAQKAKIAERYDDSAMKEIEGLMEKHGISDYELGAKLYAVDTKPATPTYDINDFQWNMPNLGKDIDIKDSAKLKQNARAKAGLAIADIIRKRAS